MFTGLIEEIGHVKSIQRHGTSLRLAIGADKVLEGVKIDDSICVSGVCLTVITQDENSFTVQVVDETLRKTSLGNLNVGARVNLERALRPSDRLGGHFVQGHVDGVARVVSFENQSSGKLLRVELPNALLPYVIPQGSIALEGVSLTVARIEGNHIGIALIPHTLTSTTLGEARVGDALNVETDLLGKYIARLMQFSKEGGLTENKLKEWGY
jgi:riboflavin synthase